MPGPNSLTPAQIVAELDRYIVGQRRAKRAVAIAGELIPDAERALPL
jgi:ATP-dependent protease HslVU (ClpYQ) ATPase subunit